jgi:putative ABC transport system permease protein
VYRVSGVGVYGGSADSGGYQVVAFAPETASRVLGEPGRFDAIQVVAASGVSETELVANLRATLGDGETEVLSGTDAVAEARTQAGAAMSFMNTFLLTFAIVALLVGSFVIYNTFSISGPGRRRCCVPSVHGVRRSCARSCSSRCSPVRSPRPPGSCSGSARHRVCAPCSESSASTSRRTPS